MKRTEFTDTDGHRDSVYAFHAGTKTHTAMQRHFGCYDAGVSFPLMGYPSVGRDGHHSNRLVPEDLFSYGGGSAFSVLSLAGFEDLKVGYVARYEHADAVYFGRNQGCAFVTSRCESHADDRSVDVTADPRRCGNVNRRWALNVLGDSAPPNFAPPHARVS